MTKKYLKNKAVNVIEVEGEKLTIDKSFGATRKAMSGSTTITPEGKPTIDAGLLSILRTVYSIKDWTLTDEDGEKLPITIDTFDNVLDEEFVGLVIQAVSGALDKDAVKEKEKN